MTDLSTRESSYEQLTDKNLTPRSYSRDHDECGEEEHDPAEGDPKWEVGKTGVDSRDLTSSDCEAENDTDYEYLGRFSADRVADNEGPRNLNTSLASQVNDKPEDIGGSMSDHTSRIEGSPAHSNRSLESQAMSESEPEAGYVDIVNAWSIFPVDGKYYSQEDKQEILSMPEIMREQILAERAQEVERSVQDSYLRRLLRHRNNVAESGNEKKKRKVHKESQGGEETPRKSCRTKSKTSELLETYKKRRQQRSEQRRRDQNRRNRAAASPSKESQVSCSMKEFSNEVEVEDGQESPLVTTTTMPALVEPVVELKDFERIRVGRTNFANVCFYPQFEETISGCFCRISISFNAATNQNIYQMAQIRGFVTREPYRMDEANGRPFMTDQWAVLSVGKTMRELPFIACSDSRFTVEEYDNWVKLCEEEKISLPTKQYLADKLNGIHALLNHTWTEKEIDEKLKRQSKYKLTPKTLTNGIGEAYHERSTYAEKPLSQQDRLERINAQNRLANSIGVRQALINERRRKLEASKVAKLKANNNRADRVKRDSDNCPSSTKETVQKEEVIPDVKKSVKADTTSAIAAAAAAAAARGLGGCITTRTVRDDEVIASLDLEIDIDI